MLKIEKQEKIIHLYIGNDRCTTVAEFDNDTIEDLQRRVRDENGNSILVPQDMDYQEWKEKYIDKTLPYDDITNQTLQQPNKNYKIIEQNFFEDDSGNKYEIDGKNVFIKANAKEREVANLLGKIYGEDIRLIPVVLEPKGIKTPDYIVNGEKFDLKEPTGNAKTTIYDLFKHKSKQANNFVIDIHLSKLSEKDALEQTKKMFYSSHRKWINKIILMKNNKIFKVLKRV